MRGSIAAFHQALDRDVSPELDGAFGAHLVTICEEAARGVPDQTGKPGAGGDVRTVRRTGFGRHRLYR